MDKHVDVVVVGAGPVGLLTAIELNLGGARVLVLERLTAPSLDMKAGGLGPLGLEALERRGMATDIAVAEARNFAAMAQAGSDPRAKGSKYSGPLPYPKGRPEGTATAFPPGGSAGPRSHAGRPRSLSGDRRAPRV
jgi:2-polyprenyl-6-methoxyphenol hydroxylase-like FAD-dependent oxidoreductase